ncbi:hypothetical protein [Nocardioides sp.]|uniref:hypothetical protein n=1 Tax=Nocardioides sp. TaxID=35761 RepID=UPI0026299F3E|nr:hypothetical protein [Nocardioides sp.]MDI6910952.1 hypothetical protein [Nocardioides sp.]
MRVPAAVAGLLGGLCWLGAYAADAAGAGAGLVDALTWAGVALLVVATLVAGASLVSRSATWLRVLVAVCFALLAGSVLEVVREGGDPVTVDAVFGAGAVVVAAALLARGRRTAPAPPPRSNRGSHAR